MKLWVASPTLGETEAEASTGEELPIVAEAVAIREELHDHSVRALEHGAGRGTEPPRDEEGGSDLLRQREGAGRLLRPNLLGEVQRFDEEGLTLAGEGPGPSRGVREPHPACHGVGLGARGLETNVSLAADPTDQRARDEREGQQRRAASRHQMKSRRWKRSTATARKNTT